MKYPALIFALLFTAASWAEQAAFAPEDVFRLNWVSDLEVSPDGEFVVYSHNFMDIMEDRRRANLWRIDSDGKNARPITTGAVNDGGAAISPDSTRVAYVSADEKGAQIFVRWLEGGETLQLTRQAKGPGNLAWSPGGKYLAFTMMVPSQPTTIGTMPKAPEGAEWAKPPTVVDRIPFRADGAGTLPLGYTHVFVVPANGGAPRQLTEGEFNYGSPAWSADGKSLIVVGNQREDWRRNPLRADLYRVSLEDGSITALTDRDGPDVAPRVSPDGKRLAWLGFDDRELSNQQFQLHVMDMDGGEPKVLLGDLDRSIDGLEWAADSRALYISYDDQGLSRLAKVDLRGRKTDISDALTGLSLSRPYTGADFAVGGRDVFAITTGDPQRPAELAIGRGTGEPRTVTSLNDNLVEHRDMAPIEELWLESSYDGKPVQAWVAYPPGFDKDESYPLILEIHGGPHTAYGPHFAAEIQLFAAAGYVVVYVNPRGSTSYGSEFALEIDKNYPSQDYDDLMSAVDAVIAKGSIDTERLYVTGGSGGGVLTAWTVGKTDRFAAAVVAKPVINWISFVLSADNQDYFSRYWFTAMPWEDVNQYWERSPLALVGNVTTPTMLLTGEADWRTPMWESEQYHAALMLRGVDTALVRIPGASHSIARRPSQLIAKVAAILGWFEKYGAEEEGEE
jgi:acylaminoacyl-peptidase